MKQKVTMSIDGDVWTTARSVLPSVSSAVENYLSYIGRKDQFDEAVLLMRVLQQDIDKVGRSISEVDMQITNLQNEIEVLQNIRSSLDTQKAVLMTELAEQERRFQVKQKREAKHSAANMFTYLVMLYKGDIEQIRQSPDGAMVIEAMYALGMVESESDLTERIDYIKDTRSGYFA